MFTEFLKDNKLPKYLKKNIFYLIFNLKKKKVGAQKKLQWHQMARRNDGFHKYKD